MINFAEAQKDNAMMRTLSTLLVSLCFVGCAAVGQKNDMNRLQEAVESYSHAYRWKNYDSAVLMLQPDLREPYLAAYEEDESSLQIEDIRVVRVELEAPDRAKITLRTRFMLLPSVTVQKKKLTQYWVKIGDQWLMEAEENSIRLIDPLSKSDLAKKRTLPPNAQMGNTEIEVEPPKSKEAPTKTQN